MSLLMILVIALTVEIFFAFIAVRDDRRDKRMRGYKKAIRIMAAYLGRPCAHLARYAAGLIKSKKEG